MGKNSEHSEREGEAPNPALSVWRGRPACRQAGASPYKSLLTIAIQNRGRLVEGSSAFLKECGLSFRRSERDLSVRCNDDIEIIFLRDDDIPEYVSRGAIDFGIVGENVLYEKNSHVKVIQKLGFGKCTLVIAVPKNSGLKTMKDLNSERIATTYPHLLKKFLKHNDITAAIIPIRGSVEVAPRLNLADAICDLTQTGTTLRENGLIPIQTILESQAVLIQSPSMQEAALQSAQKFLSTLPL